VLADTASASSAVALSDTERGIEVPADTASSAVADSDTFGVNVLATTVTVSSAVTVSDTERGIELAADDVSEAFAPSDTEALYTTPPSGSAEKGAVESGAKPNI
jgi:hypothetical protein